jgi:DMSO/TMAO reductase YedYZ molybdopterin-dependent catalytic subunit
MSFFERKRAELAEQGIDPARLPPGQYGTERFPALQAGGVPDVDLAAWDFTVDGLVAEERSWSWQEFRDLPAKRVVADIHCVTKWSKFDTEWEGVPVGEVWERVAPLPEATHVLIRAYEGFTGNLAVDDFLREDNLFAYAYGGNALEPDHGYPLRLFVPHLYFWKSVKWVRGFTVLDHDTPGFWERNGYHMRGDPYLEQRFWGD